MLVLATLFVQHKIATARGRISSLQLLQLLLFLLVALVLFPTLKPFPSALEGQPAPNPAATPCRSSQTSALGDLQTGYTMLGSGTGRGSFHECATSKTILGTLKFSTVPCDALYPTLHVKVPCVKGPITARHQSRRPHTSRTLCRTTPHTAIVRPEPPPLCDGTSPLHSKQHSNTIVHVFQLVFHSRVRSGKSRRCVINKRKKGTAQFQTQRADARHRPTFPHTNCYTIPFLDVRNNV